MTDLRFWHREPVAPSDGPRCNSRLMALAIRFDQLIRDGVVADQAELARLGHVSRARVTQIMALLNLATDIQEAVLHLPLVERGREPVAERDLRRKQTGGSNGYCLLIPKECSISPNSRRIWGGPRN